MNNNRVRTRFAPSPTGYLHIGGVRTALFCWLYAKNQGGQFLLRIEDTDVERSTQQSIDAIIEGMNWLGLHHDDEIIYQSQRTDLYHQKTNELIQSGNAYKCFCTQEDLEKKTHDTMALVEIYPKTSNKKVTLWFALNHKKTKELPSMIISMEELK